MTDSEILNRLRDEIDRLENRLEKYIDFKIDWAEKLIRNDIKCLEKVLK